SRGGRSRVEWSLDGKWLAFLESDEKKYGAYNMDHVAVVATDGSGLPARIQAVEALDRGVSAPRFSADGKSLSFLVTDNRSVYPARVSLASGTVERQLAPPVVVSNWSGATEHVALLSGGDARPTEVYALDGAAL